MLRSRVTIGSQVACGTSHSTGHTHHRPKGAVTATVTTMPMKKRRRETTASLISGQSGSPALRSAMRFTRPDQRSL